MTTASKTHSRLLLISLVGVIFVSWSATLFLMGGVHSNISKPIAPFIGYLISWLIMMTAMMLPAEIRFALIFHQFTSSSAKKSQADILTWFFLGGYFFVWTAFGSMAYLVDLEISKISLGLLLSDNHKSSCWRGYCRLWALPAFVNEAILPYSLHFSHSFLFSEVEAWDASGL